MIFEWKERDKCFIKAIDHGSRFMSSEWKERDKCFIKAMIIVLGLCHHPTPK